MHLAKIDGKGREESEEGEEAAGGDNVAGAGGGRGGMVARWQWPDF